MTDINGVPIIGPGQPLEQDNRPSSAIVELPIALEGGQSIVEIKVKAPGIVRAATFWIQEPKVIASRMRGVEKVAQPLLYVECDPNGDMQDRVLLFQPSGAAFRPGDGWTTKYLATIIGQHAIHVFEIVQAPS
jgi:hypothetical protein